VIDQDFIDTQYREINASYPSSRFKFGAISAPHAFAKALLMGLWKHPTLILVFAIAANAAALLVNAENAATMADLERTAINYLTSKPWQLITTTALGALAGLLAGSWFGRRALLETWALFDYGRNIGRVVIFAALLIAFFGTIYAVYNGQIVVIADWGPECSQTSNCIANSFYPWYVAAMGFCTLGISDMVIPKTGVGMLIIMANVVSGFTTLGLLLAVLADQFARRA